MRIAFLLIGGVLALSSCVSTEPKKADGISIREVELQEQIDALEDEINYKDSLLSSSLSLFAEIEANLELINHKKQQISYIHSDSAMTQEEMKARIFDELAAIKNLQASNKSKLNNFNQELKKEQTKNKDLIVRVEDLQNRVIEKEFEIGELATQLAMAQEEFKALEEEYMDQLKMGNDMQEELNKAFYIVGSQKELLDENVIERQGGILGMGKVSRIKADVNLDAFKEIDILKFNELRIPYAKVKLVSDHYAGSYELIEQGKTHILKIIKPRDFWSLSKYLVIEVK